MSDPTEVVNTESESLAKLHDIKDAPKKRGRPRKPVDPNAAPVKPSFANLYEAIFSTLSKCPTADLPVPSFQIATVEVGDGAYVPIEIAENGQCKKVKIKRIKSLILEYTRTTLAYNEFYRFEPKQIRDCAEYWELASKPIPRPPHVRFANEPGLCWNRVPFNLEPGPTPLFDEMFSRMTNAKAVKAWIGSLFVPQSYMQQYVWLYGKGDNGKSSLIGFIAKIFGKEGSLAQSKSPYGEHWAEPFPGKRFVFFPDFKDFRSLDNGPLKQITGGDSILVNPKHHPAYMADFECKLMFSSNHMPPIDNQHSNMRRIIFAEMTQKPGFDSKYAYKLWNEGGAFLASCMALYTELCPHHGPISTSKDSIEQLEAWGSNNDDMFELWFKDFLVHRPGALILAHELAEKILYRFKDLNAQRACYDWLEKKGYRKTRKGNEGRPWIYRNLSMKEFNSKIP